MSSNLRNAMLVEKAKDSSELSSDSETNEISVSSINIHKLSRTPKKQLSSNEFKFNLDTSKKINSKKHPRFYSENSENILVTSKIKNITYNLKKFAEDEIVHLNKRKFSFV